MTNPFALALQQQSALQSAHFLASSASDTLRSAGYAGPLVCAGGYVRDLALGRAPKDLDLFIDGGCVDEFCTPQLLGDTLAQALGHNARVEVLTFYRGAWAKDVDHVVKLEFSEEDTFDQSFLYINKAPIPWGGVDIVVLNREEWAKALTPGGSFLSAVCSRVDTRINSIGADYNGLKHAHPLWAEDAREMRLVVQRDRAAEDMTRIHKRISRLASTKYAGWTLHQETEGGGLQRIESPPDGLS